jgi:hypothetical protein
METKRIEQERKKIVNDIIRMKRNSVTLERQQKMNISKNDNRTLAPINNNSIMPLQNHTETDDFFRVNKQIKIESIKLLLFKLFCLKIRQNRFFLIVQLWKKMKNTMSIKVD